jgi:UDP-GlcNAc:undecaprenyl-phosphate/decaprenyl-phosphate GlcNAc-1-phosphate transferase
MFTSAITILGTVTLSLVLTATMRMVANRLALVDAPGGRKQHHGDIPLCGGVSIFSTFAILTLVSSASGVPGSMFWISTAIIVVVGLVDDMLGLPALPRFWMQFFAVGLLVSSLDTASMSFGTLLPSGIEISFPFVQPLFLIFSVLFLTGLLNAWNMSDGVDGLAGGAAVVALFWLIAFSICSENAEYITPIKTLLAAVCGFLYFNMRSPWRISATVFLGDAGSTALGVAIGYFMIRLSTGATAVPFPVLAWIVVVPVIDTLSLMARRIVAGRSPMSADRLHLHHLLLDWGFSPTQTTNLIVGAAALCGGFGFAGYYLHVPDIAMTIFLLVPLAAHTVLVWATMEHAQRQHLDIKAISGRLLATLQSPAADGSKAKLPDV